MKVIINKNKDMEELLFNDNSTKGTDIREHNIRTIRKMGFKESERKVKSGHMYVIQKEYGFGYFLVFGKQSANKTVKTPSLEKSYSNKQSAEREFKRLKSKLKIANNG